MIELLPPPLLLLAFFGASLVLAVTPGPGVFYIVARSLVQGRAVGLASVAGVALGNLGNAVGAALGLAAILAALFFGAFLPQFMTPGSSHWLQSVALGVVFVLTAAATDTVYSLAAAKAAPSLAGSTRLRARGQYASGATLVGLGVAAALTGRRELA